MRGNTANPIVPVASRIKVLVNPTSGGGRALASVPTVRSLFESNKIDAEFVTTNSAQELERAAREAIAEDWRTLIAMGGDGTFQALANAAFGADVLLGILPCGGGNDFAAALGLPADPKEAAAALVQGEARDVDLLRATSAGGHSRLYVGGGGVGLDAEAAGYANGAFRSLPGRTRYIASALRALVRFTPLEVRIEFPGSAVPAVEVTTLLTAALNSPSYGAGLRLAPEASIEDGLLDVVCLGDLSSFEILPILPRLMRSGELHTAKVKRWRVERARLATTTPCPFHGDGERMGMTPVTIEVVPRAIRLLAPRTK